MSWQASNKFLSRFRILGHPPVIKNDNFSSFKSSPNLYNWCEVDSSTQFLLFGCTIILYFIGLSLEFAGSNFLTLWHYLTRETRNDKKILWDRVFDCELLNIYFFIYFCFWIELNWIYTGLKKTVWRYLKRYNL